MTDNNKKSFVDRLLIAYEEANNVPKNGWNSSQSYPYATVDDVKAATNAAFRKAGLAVTDTQIEVIDHRPASREPKQQGRAVLRVILRISDGNAEHEFQGVGEALDSGDKAFYKAAAGAIKYALTIGLLISTGDQDDPEADPTTDAPAKASGRPAKAPETSVESTPTKQTEKTLDDRLEAAKAAIANASDVAALAALKAPLAKLRKVVKEETGSFERFDELLAVFNARKTELEGVEQ